MNHRNRHLVAALNPPRWIAVANDKVLCKEHLLRHEIATPGSYAVIRYTPEVERVYDRLVEAGHGFVVKPARSARGRGVLLCARALPDRVIVQQEQAMSRRDLTFHVMRILHGEFSFGMPLDAALIEERITLDKSWILDDLPGPIDLRVIVMEGRAVMAMARLPTLLSQGRANLHAGGAGVGIDLRTGHTRGGVWRDRPATHHPDTGLELAGQPVEDLDRCLQLAEECHRAVPLGYMGVDILRDVHQGPVVIELNARPGLAVQIANGQGLLDINPFEREHRDEDITEPLAADAGRADSPREPAAAAPETTLGVRPR